MAQITLTGIVKEFPGVRALDGVDLEILPGEIHALCGENGAGKSTLMKVLSGLYPAGDYEGEIRLDGQAVHFKGIQDAEKAGIAIIHQELALVGGLSVAENLFLGHEPRQGFWIDQDRLLRESRAMLAEVGLALSPETPVRELGMGNRQLVEIAKALAKRSEVLILDEPTAALTESEIQTLFGILKNLRAQKRAIVYISHKLDEVFRLSDRITVLRDGRTVATAPLGEWTEDRVIREMVGRTLAERFPARHRPEASLPLLQVDSLAVMDERRPLEGISFEVQRGEIVGIAGLMGAGRTELAMALFGMLPKAGSIRLEGKAVSLESPREAIRAGIALITEDRKRFGLVLDQSIQSNLSLSILDELRRGLGLDEGEEARRAQKVAADLKLRAVSLEKAAKTLSGGNQQKVVLGKGLLTRPRLLILDEPTRGIDVGAKWEIYRLMNEWTQRGLGILMISSELPEILGLSDRILVMREGRLAGTFTREEATPERLMRAATTGRKA